MGRIFLTYIVVGVSLYFLTAFAKEKTNLKGEWKIETVIVESDTLYHNENRQFTIDFYKAHMSGWDKSEDDVKYITKCLHSTFTDLKRVRLIFNRKNYSQTTIIPCWDHINFARVNKGKYKSEGDSISLLNDNNSILMDMKHDKSIDRLTYSNIEHKYQIIYAKVNGK